MQLDYYFGYDNIQDGRGCQDPPHDDCAQSGDCHLRDAMDLRQPQPSVGDDLS